MAILKKIKAATLMEALVATVLIVIIFIVASVVLNNVLLNTFAHNTHKISYRMNELEYHMNNEQLVLPYGENFEGWEITIQKDTFENGIVISALNQEEKEILRKRIYAR